MLLRAPQLLVCAAAFAAFAALAYAQDLCDTALIGNMTDDAFNLEEKRVEPDLFTLEISEADVCSDSEPVGLKVTACDSDQAPAVYLVDTTRGLVVREGNLETAAYVYITVFCAYDSNEVLSESSESPNPLSRLSSQLSPQLISSPSLSPPVSSLMGGPSSILGTPPTQPSSSPSPIESTTIPPTPSESPQLENTLPTMQLESRFSAVSQNGPPVPLPVSLSSRGKMPIPENIALWKQHIPPSLGKLKRPTQLDSDSALYRGEGHETLLPKGVFLPKLYDSYESVMKDLPSWGKYTYSPSLAKRFSGSRPDHPPLWFPNRAPMWLKHPARRPASPGFKYPGWGTRKSLSRLRRRPSGRSYEDGEPWSPNEEDLLSLHWSEEPSDQYPGWAENQQLSRSVSGGPLRLKYPQSHNLKGAYAGPLLPERPPPLSARHPMKQQSQYSPSPNEEDPSQLSEWKDQPSVTSKWTKRRIIPKLLLLLQEQDHSVTTRQKCESAHSVEDGEPWWQNLPPEQSDDNIPWAAEYIADYSADDGETWGSFVSPGRYVEDNDHSRQKYITSEYKEGAEWSGPTMLPGPIPPPLPPPPPPPPLPPPPPPPPPTQWCARCHPPHPGDDANQFRPPHSPTRYNNELMSGRVTAPDPPLPPPDDFRDRTERPMLSSTIRHSVSWVKNTQAATPFKKPNAPAGEQAAHAQSAEPWSFLSKLLLSHPSFRDSTHVIRI